MFSAIADSTNTDSYLAHTSELRLSDCAVVIVPYFLFPLFSVQAALGLN
jgi:hypothetical protein